MSDGIPQTALRRLEDTFTDTAVDRMSGYNIQVVTLLVGDELSREIARFADEAVTHTEGHQIAGPDGAATTNEWGEWPSALPIGCRSTAAIPHTGRQEASDTRDDLNQGDRRTETAAPPASWRCIEKKEENDHDRAESSTDR